MEQPKSIHYKSIGYIRTPFKERKGTPIQSYYSETEGWVKIFSQYGEGLSNLEDFSHIHLLYHFHQTKEVKMKVVPFLDKEERGLFATRAPLRPNPIGTSIVELISINYSDNILNIRGVDILDYTPLIDIKPYVPLFDQRKAKTGWISYSLSETRYDGVSNGRF